MEVLFLSILNAYRFIWAQDNEMIGCCKLSSCNSNSEMESNMCILHPTPVRKGRKNRAEREAGLQVATTIASADTTGSSGARVPFRDGARGLGLVLLLWSVTGWVWLWVRCLSSADGSFLRKIKHELLVSPRPSIWGGGGGSQGDLTRVCSIHYTISNQITMPYLPLHKVLYIEFHWSVQ